MSKQRRAFKPIERNALFAAANGKCQICGAPLEDTWEADHITAYSKGGNTDILNGQALCQKCNRMKGSNDLGDKIGLRPFQREFVDKTIQKALSGQKVLVVHAAAGSGKTLGSHAAADALLSRGLIDQVIVLVPRLNLAHQYELDWKEMSNALAWKPSLRKILHRANSFNRLIPRDADGYVTTYQSLCANPKLHIETIAAKRTCLILDEAQQLGYDELGYDTSKSAYWVEELGKHAAFIIVMSGTPYRADDKPLLFAMYDEPDSSGYRPLLPDLEATYRDGVRERYLRRFEYRLAEGGYTWNAMSGTTDYNITQEEASVYHALQLDEFWQPLIDEFVSVLDWQQKSANRRFAGLIACLSQNQAKDVERYLKRMCPHLKVLIAISDDGEVAHKALRDFKTGKYDVLVTVSMAYVGYDYKWINIVLLLTPIRTRGYLMQLVARGLRVISSIDYEKQPCYIIAPDDPKMKVFVDYMRGESDAGYREYVDKERPIDGGPNEKKGHELGYASNAFISELRALGIDPNSDLTPEELAIATQIQRANNYPFSVVDMMSIYRAFHSAFQTMQIQPEHTQDRPKQTESEKIKDARGWIDKRVGSFANQMLTNGYDPVAIGKFKAQIWNALNRAYTVKSVNEIETVDDLRVMAKTLLRWKEQGYIDGKK